MKLFSDIAGEHHGGPELSPGFPEVPGGHSIRQPGRSTGHPGGVGAACRLPSAAAGFHLPTPGSKTSSLSAKFPRAGAHSARYIILLAFAFHPWLPAFLWSRLTGKGEEGKGGGIQCKRSRLGPINFSLACIMLVLVEMCYKPRWPYPRWHSLLLLPLIL